MATFLGTSGRQEQTLWLENMSFDLSLPEILSFDTYNFSLAAFENSTKEYPWEKFPMKHC